jgi:hypothetical protein
VGEDGKAYRRSIIVKKGARNKEVMDELRKEFKDVNVQINSFFRDGGFERELVGWDRVSENTLVYAQGKKYVNNGVKNGSMYISIIFFYYPFICLLCCYYYLLCFVVFSESNGSSFSSLADLPMSGNAQDSFFFFVDFDCLINVDYYYYYCLFIFIVFYYLSVSGIPSSLSSYVLSPPGNSRNARGNNF